MRFISRLSFLALASITVGAASAAAQSGGQKIAYVNSQKIIAVAPGRAAAEAEFKKDMAAYKAQVQRMGDSLQTVIANYDKASATMSPARKAAMQKTIQAQQTAYQQRVQDLQQQAQQRQTALIQPIMDRIDSVIEAVRAQEGYSLVLDAGNQSGVVVAADSSLDITDKVIARLKSTSPPTASAPKTSTGPALQSTGVRRPKSPPAERR